MSDCSKCQSIIFINPNTALCKRVGNPHQFHEQCTKDDKGNPLKECPCCPPSQAPVSSSASDVPIINSSINQTHPPIVVNLAQLPNLSRKTAARALAEQVSTPLKKAAEAALRRRSSYGSNKDEEMTDANTSTASDEDDDDSPPAPKRPTHQSMEEPSDTASSRSYGSDVSSGNPQLTVDGRPRCQAICNTKTEDGRRKQCTRAVTEGCDPYCRRHFNQKKYANKAVVGNLLLDRAKHHASGYKARERQEKKIYQAINTMEEISKRNDQLDRLERERLGSKKVQDLLTKLDKAFFGDNLKPIDLAEFRKN